MSFIARLQRAREILAQQARLSTRALERELEIGGAELDEIIEELVDVQQVARREGKILVWIGPPGPGPSDVPRGPEPRPAPPAQPADTAGARKVVTLVFADLIGSTSLHERLDAESVTRLMDRYYRTLRGAVEAHGGTLVKLMGDGVMAAFGVPRVAEDDAIRAVRAGVAMQKAFRELAHTEFAAVGDIGLRVGINTGEVVVAADNTDVVGDPVNVAARLQAEAHDGQVVIGESTRRLVATLVRLAPLGSFALKGRAEAIKAYRVESLDRPVGAATAAFVGRDDELGRITAVYETACATPAARLAVLLGSPGLGKSRLIAEVTRRLGDAARVVTAHCDAAGGATFAPVAAALREFFQIEAGASPQAAQAVIEAAIPVADTERSLIAGGIAAVLAGSPASPEETFFVIRRLLAGLAATQPVVLVIDDLQWAEPLLLDLVEHLVQWGSGTPLLVLVGARPELRDLRSSLVTPGGLVADVVTLSGLDAGAAMRLAANVIGAADLPAAVAAKVLATSEGNPLFVGELVRMLVDEGALERQGERWIVGANLAALEMPPTIHALLAARIERLGPGDRTVLERAAVVGRHFSRSAVAALLGRNGSELDARLEALRRTELIERDTGWFLGEPVLRFHHVLIRDAAYRRLLKGTRAELHEQLADWIEAQVEDAPEHDETIGWHLEQAHQHRRELGPLDAKGKTLGERAAQRLAAAGRRALARDDLPVAADLLGRAIDRLDPEDPTRAELALDWCEALLSAGDVVKTKTALAELGRFLAPAAESSANKEETSACRRLSAWHACFTAQLTVLTEPQGLQDAATSVAAAARELAALGDRAGEAKAHFVHALALARLGEVGDCEAALDRALAAARGAGDRRRANTVLAIAPVAALWGPNPVTRASGRCLDVVRVLRITQGAPAVEAVALSCQGVLEALRGRTEAARRMIASAHEMVEELGITQRVLEADVSAGLVELLEGDAVAAERKLRGAYEGLRDLGLGIGAAQASALLARALLAQGRDTEAEALSHESELLAGDDLKSAIAWRGVRAEALARRGEHVAAVALASKAVELAAATDALLDHADARLALAAALRAAGRGREADAEEQRAVALWEAKGATVLADGARRRGTSEPENDPRPLPQGDHREVGPPPAPRLAKEGEPSRRVQPNAATAMLARLHAHLVARDFDAVAKDSREDMESIDHPSGSNYGREAIVASLRRFFRSRDPHYEAEPLATLGDFLVLARRHTSASGGGGGRFDVGAYENDALELFEVDAFGKTSRTEVFAADKLGNAVAHLYERYAELLPEGPERERAAATARSLAGWNGPIDADRLATTVTPSMEMVDHRNLGTWSTRGAAEFLDHTRLQTELAIGFTGRTDGVLALAPDALLVRCAYFGIARDSGGAFENVLLQLFAFGADGLIARGELWEPDLDAEALARFDELVAESTSSRVRRRVQPNAASAAAERMSAAIEGNDAAAVSGLVRPDYTEIDHPTGSTYGKAEALASVVRFMRSENVSYHMEPLATLGRLLLSRRRIRASGARGQRFDVGEYENETISLTEVDEQGLLVRCEVFAPDRLGEAIQRLYEMYGESSQDGSARARATRIASVVAVWNGPTKIDHVRTAFAPTTGNIDHRVFSTWDARDREEVLRHFRLQLDLVPDFAGRYNDVVALNDRGVAARMTFFGTARDSGGRIENTTCFLFCFDDVGCISHSELFENEQIEQALARFVELTTDAALPSPAPPPPAVENLAQRVFERNAAFWRARDWDGFTRQLAAGFRFEDRRSLSQVVMDVDAYVRFVRALGDMASARLHIDYLATRGSRLCLAVIHPTVAEGDVGPSDLEYLYVIEADEHERTVSIVAFDRKDLDAAHAELDRRFEAGEGAEVATRIAARELSVSLVANLAHQATERAAACWRVRDWDGFAHVMVAGFRFDDRRSLSHMVLDLDAYVFFARALGDMASASIHVDCLATRGEHLCLTRHRFAVAEGDVGPSDLEYLYVVEGDDHGRIVALVAFDNNDLDSAYAELERRFDAGEGAALGGFVKRWVDGIARRDWQALIEMCSPGLVEHDHRPITSVGTTSGRETFVLNNVRSWIDLAPDTMFRVAHIRTSGRAILWQIVWEGTRDGGRYELPLLLVSEHDEHGRCPRVDIYEPATQFAAARTRFEELGAARFANVVTSFLGSYGHAFARRDWPALTDCLANDCFFDDRRPLLRMQLPREGFLEQHRIVFDVPNGRWTITPIATRGEQLMLVRMFFEGEVPGGGGALEIEHRIVFEVDADALLVALVLFEPDAMDSACAELDRRFEAGLADGCKRAWAANRDIAAAINAHDPEAVVATFTSGYVLQDHRRVSWGSMLSDPAVLIRSQRLMYELAPDYHVRVDHVRLTDRGTLAEVAEIGTRDGGEFETPYLWVIEVDEGGRSPRVDLYEIEQIDLARARLAELGAPPQPPGSAVEVAATFRPQAKAREGASVAKHRLPVRAGSERETFASIVKRNLATTSMEQILAMLFGSDGTGPTVEVDRSIFAPEFVWEDRRPIVGLSGGLELFLASAHARLASGARLERRAVVGTAGERVAISHVLWAGGPPDGRFEVEYFVVTEVNEAGLATAVIFIDPDDWRAAQREAWKRWAAIDPVAEEATSSLNDALDAFSEKNLDRVRDIFAEDLVVEDRRRTGAGRLDGREAYLRSLMVLFELAPDSHIEFGHFWLAFAAGGSLCTFRHVGTLRGGGEFENEYIQLALRQGGRTTRMELFEIEAADAALARFEELRAEIAGD